MDGSLSSSRYDRGGGGGDHYGGNNNHYRGGGGGGGGRRYNNRRGGRGGGRHNRRHQPYHNRRGPRGPRPPGNRFGGNATTSVDPATAVQRQLAAMVSRVGELRDPPPATADQQEQQQQRPVMQAVAKNIQDLANVLCSQANAPMFLKFDKPSEDAPDKIPSLTDAAGPLVVLIVNCAATLPLQTPAYVGLTLAVEQQAPQPDYGGFCQRCVDYTMHILSQQLQQVLTGNVSASNVSQMQHLLRYLILLGKANLVVGTQDDTLMNEEDAPTSVAGLLLLMTRAAMKGSGASVLLRHLVLGVLPYALSYLPSEIVSDVMSNLSIMEYQSPFAPGLGAHALLLQKPQHEEGITEDDDEEEEDDDDDEDDTSGQVCDTMQDLMRCVKSMVEGTKTATRFALLTDAPYNAMETECTTKLPPCKALVGILNSTEESVCDLEGKAVYGRLPIFGSPPDDDDDEEEEDDEEDMEDSGNKNEQLEAYEKTFSLLDRFFFADALRHCLIHHQSTVTDTGVTRGSAKDTAQQVWSMCHIIQPAANDEGGKDDTDEGEAKPDHSKGFEYILVETLLSLILQASSTNSDLSPLYLSRVLLELVRVQPAVMPQALAVGVHNLFEFYLPSLVPLSRDNLSSWFSLHLTNTDYQWPKAYWDHWAKYVGKNRNSRGDFVTLALELMLENLNSTGTMVTTCLPPGSSLATGPHLIQEFKTDASYSENESLVNLEAELKDRLWEKTEDPDSLETYLTEVAAIEGAPQWWRTLAVMRALLDPMDKYRQKQIKQLADAADASMDAEPEKDDSNVDVLVVTTDAIVRYQGVIRVALQQDDDGSDPVAGGASLLEALHNFTSKSEALLEGCLQCLLVHDIVNPASVLKWLLGGDDGSPTRHWYKLAIAAFRMGLKEVKKKLTDEIGMVVDGTDEDAERTRKVTALREYAAPLIREAVEQVCRGLAAAEAGEAKGMKPMEVDLVEGLKQYVVQTRLFLGEALTSLDAAAKPAKEQFVDFEITGEALSRLVRESGSSTSGIELLGNILERM